MSNKEDMEQAFIEGYTFGKDVEELREISVETAKGRFERWYALNFEE